MKRFAAVAALAVSVAALAGPVGSSSKEQGREALKKTLADVIARTPLKSARVGVVIQSLDDGTVVFAQNPDELLNPASNVKMVTAAAALSKLGLDYRYETEFLTDAEVKADGKVRVLYVRGKGDPTLNTDRLFGITSELLHAGVKEVGDIVVDDTFFDADRVPPGFDQENSDRSYMAPPGGLSLNWNAIGIYVRPGEHLGDKAIVEVEPASEFANIDAQITTGPKRRTRFSVTSEPDRDGVHQKILARGTIGADERTWSVWKKIDNPAMYFGYTLKRLLADRGVKVKGRVRPAQVPPGAKMLYVSASDTFDIVLKKMNKHSSNFVAEQLIKTLGAEVKGVPGTTPGGIEVIEDFLEKDVGLPRGSYVMKNGSGLNDTNRFSAAQMTRVLRVMYDRFPLAPEYLSSVGIAGKDGTLKYRFEGSDAVGRLRAKTGTLENVSALSGYVQAVGGERFVFSVLVNDFAGRAGTIVQHIDALGAAVAATGSANGPDQAVAAVMAAPTVVGPIEEVKARVKTYLALGQQRDKRNISFLRTAWRTERDPAVRAVIADSLYQSDPQDYLGARTLLDSFTASDDVYGRLRKVSRELSIDVPAVPSVVSMASAGNMDAMARVLELSRAAIGDDKATSDVSDSLVEVARTAPDELLLCLHKAPPDVREASYALIALGMVKAADADHPFWPALKKAMGAVDPDLASFAKETEETLSMKIAQAKAPLPTAADASVATPTVMPAAKPVLPEAKPGG